MKALFFLLLTVLFCHAEKEPEPQLMGRTEEASLAGKVVVLPIGQEDLINKQAFRFWHRMIERAVDEKARAVVLELDTPGGLAFDTRDIITDDFGKLEIPLIAWVKREAMSAGALISFSADRIYMASGTRIGSAGIINSTGAEMDKVLRAKLESAFEASLRPVVEKKGHRMDVLEAMMFIDEDEERTFGSATVRKNGLLALTAAQAIEVVDGKPLLAAGIAENLDEVLKAEGMEGAGVIRPEPQGFEKFAWWIAAISPILIAIGIGAAYFELKAPGFGVFGFISFGVFALFFFGNNVAGNLAGYELMAVFVVGIVLIILEIFIIPGGIAGIIGGLMVVGSLWFAMADRVDFERLDDGEGVGTSISDLLIGPGLMLALGLLGAVGLMLLFMRFLPDLPLFRGLVAKQALASGQGGDHAVSYVGKIGEVVSDLRPTGTILIDGEKKDAISKFGLVEKGKRVRVLEEGMTFQVEEVKEGD